MEYLFIIIIVITLVLPSSLLSILLSIGWKENPSVNEEDHQINPYLVLIPAKDESLILADTITLLKEQMTVDGRILVVADNCSDQTYEIAKGMKVEVYKRSSKQVGKGHAIQFGLDQIDTQDLETLVILDADSRFLEGGLARLVRTSQALDQVSQSSYLMKAHKGAQGTVIWAEFFWFLKNHIRPYALERLGSSCQLYGSGMAFPMRLLKKVSFSSSNIVEDKELTHRLFVIGEEINFETRSKVISYFPVKTNTLESQRNRWEYGHMKSITSSTVYLKDTFINLNNPRNIFSIIEYMLPPTTLLLVVQIFIIFVLFALGQIASGAILIASTALLLSLVCINFKRYKSRYNAGLSIHSLCIVIRAQFWRYVAMLKSRQDSWIKTKRE